MCLFRVDSGRFLSYSKKKKISQNHDSLSLVVIRCQSMSFVVLRCHSLSLVLSRCTTRCHLLYHSLSFIVTRCHLLSLVVPLVVNCCTTRCHSLPFDVSLICIFINEQGGNFSSPPQSEPLKSRPRLGLITYML